MALTISCIMRIRFNLLHQRVIMVLVALAMTLVLFAKGRQTGNTSGMAALSAVVPASIVVQISGDVAHSGIYEIIDKKMTNSVIQMSKPFCGSLTDTAAVQLASRLHTGEELHIVCKSNDSRPFIRVTPIKTSHRLTLGILLDLNLMNETDLELLPWVGPALAKRIVMYRQINGDFRSLDELLLVGGIGEKKFQKLLPYFKVPIQQ